MFLKQAEERYVLGTTNSKLKKFERELLAHDWHAIRDGIEVTLCPSLDGDDKTFILCRNCERNEKTKASCPGSSSGSKTA